MCGGGAIELAFEGELGDGNLLLATTACILTIPVCLGKSSSSRFTGKISRNLEEPPQTCAHIRSFLAIPKIRTNASIGGDLGQS